MRCDGDALWLKERLVCTNFGWTRKLEKKYHVSMNAAPVTQEQFDEFKEYITLQNQVHCPGPVSNLRKYMKHCG